jgi:2-oxo-4-hydroxy-4-carboxy-5-ureidoimidazoline decarboxylase
MNLEELNAWTEDEAIESFQRCCGSSRWCVQMTRLRPFESEAVLYERAERVWWALAPADWLEAFASHPKIGERNALRAKFAATAAWSQIEQAGVAAASDEVLRQLDLENIRYERRFGYTFIVCATGKTAAEMLGILQRRLSNNPVDEIKAAAAEQSKITRLRLERIAP